MMFDYEFARQQYPVFRHPQRRHWAFFENAGGSYVPDQVIGALNRFYHDYKVQPYGPFQLSVEAGEAMDSGYDAIAQLLNVPSDQLTLGPSTTLNFYVLSHALRPCLRPGDEVIVTNQDHEANIGCWDRLSEFGVVVRTWSLNSDHGELALDDLRELVSSKTRAICFNLCSNIVGSYQSYADIAEIAHEVGAWAIGDAVSFAPHRVIDVADTGLDAYLFSTYKTFATHVGAMWIRPELNEHLTCQGHYFNKGKPFYAFNPTGPQHAQIAALAGLRDYLELLDQHHIQDAGGSFHNRAKRVFELIADHETRLASQLLEALRGLPGVRIVGQHQAIAGRRAPTISFVPARRRPGDVARSLAASQIAVRNGHFYALRCLQALGIEEPEQGVVRVSMVHYNSPTEVERLIDALAQAVR